jgi:membrane associated rhomboid family serine protease
MLITLIIITVTCVVSFMALKSPKLLDDLIFWPPALTRQREYYRLFTYGLIHADISHLFFNMLTLFFFGRVMENVFAARLGTLGFALFYLGALFISILPTYIKQRKNANYRSLGASGAVSAVLFSYILFMPWSRIIVFILPIPAILYAVLYVVYSVMMDRHGYDNINHSAHLWGAAYGVLFTLFVYPSALTSFLSQLANPSVGF